nr:hypothetical protein CFP56_05418 [Quercus suber]
MPKFAAISNSTHEMCGMALMPFHTWGFLFLTLRIVSSLPEPDTVNCHMEHWIEFAQLRCKVNCELNI